MEPLTLKNWLTRIGAASLVFVLLYLWVASRVDADRLSREAKAAQEAHQAALQDAALGKDALARANALQAALDATEAQRRAALTKVDRLQAQLDARPMPPAPGDAPKDPAQVLADLRAMGTSPLPLAPSQVAFPSTDAPTLWTWGKQAARVPALESRLAAQDELASGLRLALGTTAEQLSVTEKQRDEFKVSTARFQSAFDGEQRRGDALTLEVGTLTRQRDRARSTRIFIGIGALAGGFYLGRKL